MTDQDIIRKAVELADGWTITHIYEGEDWAQYWHNNWSHEEPVITFHIQKPYSWGSAGIDALAAQLVRQVDAHAWYFFEQDQYGCSTVFARNGVVIEIPDSTYPPNRTMNTLRAIVESEVLE